MRRVLALLAVVATTACAIGACAGGRVPASPLPAAPSASAHATALVSIDARAPDAATEAAEDVFAPIDAAISAALAEGKLPGCVVLAGRSDEILLRRAYGARATAPERQAMTLDTVFDLASLTKPVATSTSVMILVERGKIDLDAPASRYVSELSKLPTFTVRQLLVHTSGLPAATAISDYATIDRAALMRRIGELKPKTQPGEAFVYSDVGFVVLEEIVRRVSGKGLEAFAAAEVFSPLGMTETGFLPSPPLRARAAPTEQRDGGFIVGDVHDPRAFALGGVAGHAGLFSTGDDLARFAQAMLGKGALAGRRVLTEATFGAWLARHETPKGGRALGWDLDSAFATQRTPLFSKHAFGHGGFTGTALWVDPDRDLFLVFLSNRVHPDGKGAVNPLISEVATRLVKATDVRTGVDVLEDEGFARLRGANVGLVTNASARTRSGTSTLDALRRAEGVTLRAVFTPEHGLEARREGHVGDASYAGVPVFSLYGERWAPSDKTLEGIDTLVFDLQDVGVRFYTYASTMKRAMRIAADKKLRFVVLDRPNPLGGVEVAGPVLAAPRSFVNHHALPVRHGMTMGELARLFAADDRLDLRLEVVRMQGWRRKDYMDRTGLSWISPSPNLRTVDEVVLYPALGLLEGTNLSVGRGTDTPFEVFGAPWLDGKAVALALEGTPGVRFEATEITPTASVHAGKKCGAVRVRITERARFEPVRTAVAIAQALHARHAGEWEIDKVDRLLQSDAAMAAIRAGKPIVDVEATWQGDLAAFKARRGRFLLY